MTPALREALWWAVVFVAVAIVIAAGSRIVEWLVVGEDGQRVWRAALVLVGAAAGGGTALASILRDKS